MSSAKPLILSRRDDPLSELFSTFFRHHGFDVREARDADEGFALTRQLRPALVLMDIAMPSGYEAITKS